MKALEPFLETIAETRKVWLLGARDGMFAMLEDSDGNSYIPMWESEALAKKAAVDDWAGYEVNEMGFSELVVWLKELSRDEIDIAVSPEKDGEITAIASSKFRQWVKPQADDSYHEEDEDEPEEEGYDYGEGWAQPW